MTSVTSHTGTPTRAVGVKCPAEAASKLERRGRAHPRCADAAITPPSLSIGQHRRLSALDRYRAGQETGQQRRASRETGLDEQGEQQQEAKGPQRAKRGSQSGPGCQVQRGDGAQPAADLPPGRGGQDDR